MKRSLPTIDLILLIVPIILSLIGIITLYTLTLQENINASRYIKEFQSQSIFLVASIILLFIFIFMKFELPYNQKKFLILIFFTVFFLNLFTAFFGSEINGVRRWISIGSITIQPSEISKIFTIYLISSLLSNEPKKQIKGYSLQTKLLFFLKNNQSYIFSILIVLGITFSVFIQKSLTNTIIILMTSLIIFIYNSKNKFITTTLLINIISMILFTLEINNIANFNNTFFYIGMTTSCVLLFYLIYKKNLLKLFLYTIFIISMTSIIFPFFWNNLLADYQKDRLINFLNEPSDIFQSKTAIINIGSGQIFGQGITPISLNRSTLTPEAATDFIFSIYALQFGFIGTLILSILYLILICRLIYMAYQSKQKQHFLFFIGFAFLIGIQSILNISMNIGLIPIGGSTLPFISAGGSSLVTFFIGIGICQKIYQKETERKFKF